MAADASRLLDERVVRQVAGRQGAVTTTLDAMGQCSYAVAGEPVVAVFVQALPTPADAAQVVEMERVSRVDGRDPGDLGDAALVYTSHGFPGLVTHRGEVLVTLTPLAPALTEEDLMTLARSAVDRLAAS